MAGKGGAIAGGAGFGASAGSAFGPWGTAIGGILGGIGGLFGGGSDNGPGLGGLIRKARRHGLHPLAVLGSPIAGNFAVPTRNTAAGDALGALGSAISETGRSIAARAEARELADRARRQDDLAAGESAARVRSLDAAAARDLADAARIRAAREHTAASFANSRRGEWPKLHIVGSEFTPGAGTNSRSSAQDVQDQYGDVVESVYGVGRLLGDATVGLYDWSMTPRPMGPGGPGSYGETFVP